MVQQIVHITSHVMRRVLRAAGTLAGAASPAVDRISRSPWRVG